MTFQIDTWIYDFGRLRFMEEIVFENGIIRSMRPLGYGTVAGRRASLELLVAPTERAVAIARRRRARYPAEGEIDRSA